MRVVCVIDDDPSVRKGVANLLKSEGYSPVCFQSGESFLASPWKEQADCVLLDLCMPGLQGQDVQRSLNARGSRVPVICMSARASEQAISLARQQGAVGFIAKPFTAEVLLAAIGDALQGRP
ncbi:MULTISPECIES: response regulator transcription factor [unclassified Pseudomonas]|uniref:response regulator transcription factor n=1 Tax=unclassified Pseudomonas TaxID=196821 RepID=UPI001BF124A5|nr:two-component response regulator [Pseudomonas sp. Pc102]